MNSRELRHGDDDGTNQTSNEVQFALVIARMIETVKTDPELLRQTVYDLARHKLQEQLVDSDPIAFRQAERALETAIRGVEEFSKQPVGIALSSVPRLSSALPSQLQVRETDSIQTGPDGLPARPVIGARRHLLGGVIRRTGLVLVVVGAALAIVQQRERLLTLGHSFRLQVSETPPDKVVAPSATTATAPRNPPLPAFPRPDDYGVYAFRDDIFTELQLIPGRAPDARVAISAAFKLPAKVNLPDGHPEFVVYRRDAASNISERAEVRVIARIAREFSSEAAGKRLDESDAWVIRSFSYPYRAAPIPDNPEMYRLRSEDPALELPPGHYALIVRNQSYYFSVNGDILDPRQCIERVITANGTFYAACKR
ncbi:hypothetical protein IC761_27705 [Bradyrhizobium commune]|uniref:Uncharacterized protein n=2 Tax=Bradyrhizobium commune TaxID=83627 RepID=A0A7S9H3Y4_9BRAD|nr:hypothetical protein IC761_27705 [Bradyrhizobium commune]